MSALIKINGIELVPLKAAALKVGYSRDYVARLAREGKIVAMQMGRNWSVDLDSLVHFSKEAEVQESLRKLDLSAERKSELVVKEKLLSLKERLVKKSIHHRRDAYAVTCATLALGFIVGASVYTAASFYKYPGTGDIAGSGLITLERESESQVMLGASSFVEPRVAPAPEVVTTVLEQAVFQGSADVRALTSEAEGILLLAQNYLASGDGTEAAFFSDPVAITYTGENSGVVKYTQVNGEIAQYPFVMVPSTAATSSPLVKRAGQ